MSSSFLTKPIEWEKYGVVYAAGQKQAGIANTCITIVLKSLIGNHSVSKTPSLMAWQSYFDAPDTFPNTPNTWGIYMCGLNLDYQLSQGGLREMQARTWARSAPIYKFIDGTNGYYMNNVENKYRSRINITFRICDNNLTLESQFVEKAEALGIVGLQGHALVGGCRIGLNNAMSFEGVYALIDFMKAFKASNSV